MGQMYGSAGQGWSSAGSYSGLFGSLIGGAWNMGLAAYNANKAKELAQYDRQQNFKFGEAAADNADTRTRALYRDLYSPTAMLKQYQEAGMSPSMMYGGMPGAGGSSGASAAGAASGTTPFVPMSMLEGAQMANIIAQTMKTKAETKNIEKDTDIKELQEEWQKMQNSQYKTEFTLLNSGFEMPDGSIKSYYDIAGEYKTYDQFIEACKKTAVEAGDQGIIQSLSSEQGQKTMRNIYLAKQQFSQDISILSSNKVAADFQKSILQAMNEEDFPTWNAKAGIAYLKQSVETNNLDGKQKKAWNDLLDKLKNKNETMATIAIILGTIANQALTQWHMPAINVNNRYNTQTTNNF